MTEAATFKKNIINLGFLQALNYILPLITIPYLLRVLGIETYGLMTFAMAAMSYVAVVSDYGFNLSATREIALKKNSAEDLAGIINSVNLIKLTTLVFSAATILIIFLNNSSFSKNTQMYVYTYLFVASQVMMPMWIYQGFERIDILTNINAIAKIMGVILIFIFVKDGNDYNLVPLLNFICGGVASATLLIYAYKKFDIALRMPRKDEIVSQLKGGWDIFLSSIFINLYANSMTFLLGMSANNVSVGSFALADKVIQAIKAMYQPVAQAMYPMVSRMFSTDLKRAVALTRKIQKISLIVNFILMILILVFAEKVIYVLSGEKLIAAANILRIMSPVPLLVSISNLYGVQIMLNLGMEKQVKLILMSGAIFGVFLSYVVVGRYYEYGAAFVVCLIEAGIAVAMYLSVRKRIVNR